MPMGMRQGILAMSLVRSLSGSSVQISGYEVAKAATHCNDGKKILPMLVLSLKPKAPRTWLKVTSLENSQAFMSMWPPTYLRSL